MLRLSSPRYLLATNGGLPSSTTPIGEEQTIFLTPQKNLPAIRTAGRFSMEKIKDILRSLSF